MADNPNFMKLNILFALGALSIVFACNNPTKNTVVANDAKNESSDSTNTQTTYQIDTIKSKIAWEGAEGLLSIVKTHNGLLSISAGELQTDKKQLVGGNFTIPLKSLTVSDIPKEKPGNAKLVKHLLAADFFDEAKFAVANFAITNVKIVSADSALISGNLTLKGISKNISFNSKITITDSTLTASTPKFYFNRKDWGIHYRTDKSFGDELIKPEIGILINLVANKK